MTTRSYCLMPEGHGRSDKPHGVSAYGPRMADDVVAVLDDLGIAKAHFMGYSTGALDRVAACRPSSRQIPHAFIIGCMSPYGFPEDMVKMTNDGH